MNAAAFLVRPATVDDLDALVRLLGELFAQEAEFVPDEAVQRRGLALVLDEPDRGEVLVAVQGDSPVAMVTLLYTVSTALGTPVALLEDMVVSRAARGTGIGGELLDAAIARCRTRGCRRITLLTDADNDGAQRFYSGRGFARSAMQPWRLVLDGDGGP